MTNNNDQRIIVSVTDVAGNLYSVLDTLAKANLKYEDRSRNLVKQDKIGNIMWRVTTAFDASGGPFVSVSIDDGHVRAYRWDGFVYDIDPISGAGVPVSLQK